jgi:hypothetical protein
MRNRTKMEAKYILKRTVCGLAIANAILLIIDSPLMLGYVFPSEARWVLCTGGAIGFGWGWYRGVYLESFKAENVEHWERVMKVNPTWMVVWFIIYVVAFFLSGAWMRDWMQY